MAVVVEEARRERAGREGRAEGGRREGGGGGGGRKVVPDLVRIEARPRGHLPKYKMGRSRF